MDIKQKIEKANEEAARRLTRAIPSWSILPRRVRSSRA